MAVEVGTGWFWKRPDRWAHVHIMQENFKLYPVGLESNDADLTIARCDEIWELW